MPRYSLNIRVVKPRLSALGSSPRSFRPHIRPGQLFPIRIRYGKVRWRRDNIQALRLKKLHRARHMPGGGYQQYTPDALLFQDLGAVKRILIGIARFGLQPDRFRRDTHHFQQGFHVLSWRSSQRGPVEQPAADQDGRRLPLLIKPGSIQDPVPGAVDFGQSVWVIRRTRCRLPARQSLLPAGKGSGVR